LVTLPGTFVGVLLGGGSPVQGGATQLLVLVALLAVEAIAVAVTVELVAAGFSGGPRGARRTGNVIRLFEPIGQESARAIRPPTPSAASLRSALCPRVARPVTGPGGLRRESVCSRMRMIAAGS
jgi:hypothetical protein